MSRTTADASYPARSGYPGSGALTTPPVDSGKFHTPRRDDARR